MLRGNRSGSTSASRNTDNTGSEDDDDQPKLAPLSVHVYAERLRGDPTSPEETGDSDPSSEYGLHSPQSVVIQESFGSKFHGESSTLAFVDALSEKWKITDSHDLRSRRREFWEAPEVCLSDARWSQADLFASGCYLLHSPLPRPLSFQKRISCSTW
jgi:hypothetical protein